ncbi:MAG: helix-turn-helix domain-containing protein [Bacteroidota bacterium]|nr:helix-turn-helix domain-containing protein [Bacteroidota bacterium]
MVTDTTNTQFRLAADFIHYTNHPVFLTGKAGTGKTTFLKHIKEQARKQMAVVAPTGVAAINCGGVTIHSFFQLPFGPFIPESNRKDLFNSNTQQHSSTAIIDKHYLLSRTKLTKERISIFRELELLVIDEISMVRADLLDEIDILLRHFRNRPTEPFGGVQLLLIGDLFQLPPVAKQEDWEILSNYYESPYFFSSRALTAYQPAYIELTTIYRQRDTLFIDILNKVRINQLDSAALQQLQEHYHPNFQYTEQDGFITLTTHNHKADTINAEKLGALTSPMQVFKAEVEQDFPEKNYPAEEQLQLKVGAQVMFIKNDGEKVRRFYNGKIGIVESIEEDKILVRCPEDVAEIEVRKYRWENIRYTLNKQNQQIEEEVIGAFTQYPLRLAWAITIHKSQGLTFEKAIIDAGQAFAPGQVYVALSRCISLEGIVLLSRISGNNLFTDERILAFIQSQQAAFLPDALIREKSRFEQQILTQLFSCAEAVMHSEQLVTVVTEHADAFNEASIGFVQELRNKITSCDTICKKFQAQLSRLSQEQSTAEENPVLRERLQQANDYFLPIIQSFLNSLHNSPVVTDSKQHSLIFNEHVHALIILLAQKAHCMEVCRNGFSIDGYLQQKQSFTTPPITVNSYAAANKNTYMTISNAPLYEALKDLRDHICETNQLPVYMVVSSNSLYEMAKYLPQSLADLKKIKGFGAAKAEKYGAGFIEIINRYCEEHGLASQVHELPGKKEKKIVSNKKEKTDTKAESVRLFREGLSIAAIAKERNLQTTTIEGHLAHYVAAGILPVEQLLSPEKLSTIEPVINEHKLEEGLTAIKNQLDESISYGDIRLALAWKQYQEQLNRVSENE